MSAQDPASVQVSVTPASRAERPLIAGLLQFYFYDFSEWEPAGSDDFNFDARGNLGDYPYLDAYWREHGRWPLLIRVDAKPAGFCLINQVSHRDGGAVERNMAEFFVARKYRRHGVASEAVRQILARHPGRWEVAVVERNAAAKLFWPRAIAAAPGVSELTRIEGDGEHWRGPIWTFRSSGV